MFWSSPGRAKSHKHPKPSTPNHFTKVLFEKLRVATEKGTVFFQVKSVAVSSQTFEGKPKVTISQIDTSTFLTKTDRQKTEQLVFIVEGVSDQQIITALAEKIYLSTNERKRINIVVAGGKYSVAKLANTSKEIYLRTQNLS